MSRFEQLKAMRESIYAIAKRYKVAKLYVFGSCARKEDMPQSDVDFVAEYLRGATYFDHFSLKAEIAELLQQDVDIVSIRTLTDDAFSQSVRKDMVAL